MLSRFLVASLLLLTAGCVAPPAGASDDATQDTVSSRAQSPMALARPQAARPQTSSLTEAAPAGLAAVTRPVLPQPARPRPAIVRIAKPLQCVPYARKLSKIALRGNAWTWWQKAKGRYERGSVPQPGAVLVFSKSRRLRLGHLAVVAEVINSREIIVHQANWLNQGQIHRYTPVRDVSENNDWSEVRVWYTPGRVYGSRNYAAYGFIYPDPNESPELRQAAN